eukprot:NODE_466_length_1450_cov_576.230550_g347_i0.p1 GENE.NODE_466_length_1450_cov_576.230550_g347_i0~~NODE_466_length_1450_cov_576.230550_g347_i0.p1  ORF type:complete len:322 (-),score=29.40 NODE_466_length_1450_cov_576.230550_g347_i0:379-1344(-)
MPGIRVDPNQVLGTWEAEVEYDSSGKPIKTKSKVKTVFDALNYDAPNFAICCDLRADGGFLPVLNDPVPVERQKLVRKTQRTNLGPAKDTFGPLAADTVPFGPPQFPDRARGAPWTSTAPGGGVFSAFPYLPEGEKGGEATGQGADEQGAAGPFQCGKPQPPAAAYPHLPEQRSKAPPARLSRLAAGKGPGLFSAYPYMSGGPPPPKEPKPAASPPRPQPNLKKNLDGGLGKYPEYMSDPFQDNPLGDGRGKSKCRGMFTCYTVTKPTLPILNVWTATPVVKTRDGVKREPASNRHVMTVQPYDSKVQTIQANASLAARTL